MGYVITASTSTVRLHDESPEPALNTIHEAIFGNQPIRTTLIERAIGSMNKKMDQFFQYGKDHYVNGLPLGNYSSLRMYESDMQTTLSNEVGYPVALDDYLYGFPSLEQFCRNYLYKEHGYNVLTGTVTSLPAEHSQSMDTAYEAASVDARGQIDALTATLRASVPVDRVVEVADTYEEQAVTRIDTYTVTALERVTCKGNDKRKTVYQEYEVTGQGTNVPELTVHFTGEQAISFNASGHIAYTESRHRKYQLADGTVLHESIEQFPAVTLKTGVQKYLYNYSYPYSDLFPINYSTGVVYQYAEYHYTDGNGKVVPGVYLAYTTILGMLGDVPPEEMTEEPVPHNSVEYDAVRDYYPIIFLRHEEEDHLREERQDTDEFKQSQYMLDMFGINILDLRDNINENSDVDGVDEAYFMVGVQLDDENKASLNYLYDFWFDIYERADSDTRFDPINGQPKVLDRTERLVAVSIEDQMIRLQVTCSGIGLAYIEGVITKVGETVVELVKEGDTDYLVYKRQIDSNTYGLLKVADPYHRNTVYGDGVIETALRDYWEDEDNHNFIIPLRRELVNKQNVFDREALHYTGMMLVFHSYDKRKTKWYESGAFKAFLIIVAVVVFIYTGMDVYSSTVAALEVSLAAAAIYLATVVLTGILINIAIKYAIRLLGPELAFLIAVLATIAAMYGVMTDTQLLQIDPTTLLNVSTSMGEEALSSAADILKSEIEAFNEDYDLLKDEVDALKELLETSDLVDPFAFIDRPHTINLNETPDQFLHRSLISNPGILAYDIVENYVASMTQLPQPKYV